MKCIRQQKNCKKSPKHQNDLRKDCDEVTNKKARKDKCQFVLFITIL